MWAWMGPNHLGRRTQRDADAGDAVEVIILEGGKRGGGMRRANYFCSWRVRGREGIIIFTISQGAGAVS